MKSNVGYKQILNRFWTLKKKANPTKKLNELVQNQILNKLLTGTGLLKSVNTPKKNAL